MNKEKQRLIAAGETSSEAKISWERGEDYLHAMGTKFQMVSGHTSNPASYNTSLVKLIDWLLSQSRSSSKKNKPIGDVSVSNWLEAGIPIIIRFLNVVRGLLPDENSRRQIGVHAFSGFFGWLYRLYVQQSGVARNKKLLRMPQQLEDLC